ncbi:MAG: hypothetical protein KDD60_04005 [Bdellovibrionales bacterium]|nr:hypothetical protein [Bdellovibrionales bacterium]
MNWMKLVGALLLTMICTATPNSVFAAKHNYTVAPYGICSENPIKARGRTGTIFTFDGMDATPAGTENYCSLRSAAQEKIEASCPAGSQVVVTSEKLKSSRRSKPCAQWVICCSYAEIQSEI